MKTCILIWVLLVSKLLPSFTKNCSDYTNYLNDKKNVVKYDELLRGLGPSKVHNFKERMTFSSKALCGTSMFESIGYLRINWFKNKGYIQQIDDAPYCYVYSFQNGSKGDLQIDDPFGNEVIVGFYVDKAAQQRLFYIGVPFAAFTEYLPVETIPVLDVTKPRCDPATLDSKLLANSKSANLKATEVLRILLLCGMHLPIWYFYF